MALLDPDEARVWFERAIEDNYRMLYGIAFNILRHSQSAEDATQEAILRAYAQISALENPNALPGWLARITQNVSRDMLKKHAPVNASALKDGEQTLERVVPTRDTGILELEERHSQLRAAVGKLPPEQAAVVTMRYMEELNINEIAERLGKKPNAVAALLHRSRATLKRTLGRKRRTTRIAKPVAV